MLLDEKRLKEIIREAFELKITLKNNLDKEYITTSYFMFIPPIGSVVELNSYPYEEWKVEGIHIDSDYEIDLYVTKIEE